MTYPSISVIVPCYNEEAIIFNTIKNIYGFLNTNASIFEIIVVSDGSTDSTVSEIKRAQNEFKNIRLIDNQANQGKGKAIKDGVLNSQNDIIVFIDADLTISINELETFLPYLANNDILIASRSLPETMFEEKNPWYRTLLAKGFRILRAIILGSSNIEDTQCGFKTFKKDTAKRIFEYVTIKRFAFDAETLFIAEKFCYTIKQLPITVRKDHRISRVNAIIDPINMLFALIRIRINSLLGKYNIS